MKKEFSDEEKRLLECSWSRPTTAPPPVPAAVVSTPGVLDPLVKRATKVLNTPMEDPEETGARWGTKINRALLFVIAAGVAIVIYRLLR
jgi:hypothetical protein